METGKIIENIYIIKKYTFIGLFKTLIILFKKNKKKIQNDIKIKS